jgi:sugar lactone lactonase YvrE
MTGRGPLSGARFTVLPTIAAACVAGAVLLCPSSAPAQNLFETSSGNGNIYEFTTNAVKSTFASGLHSPHGLAFDSAGDLFVADTGSGNVIEYTNSGTTLSSGYVTFAALHDPNEMAFDSAGDLFVSDFGSGDIYEFTNNAGMLSANPGIFASGLNPGPLAFNSAGVLFVANGTPGAIYEFSTNGVQSTFNSTLGSADGLAFDNAGDLFVADSDNTIYEFTNNAGTLSTNPVGFVSGLGYPWGLAFNSAGDLFAGDNRDGDIYEIATNGAQSLFVNGSASFSVGLAFAPSIAPIPTLTNIVVSPVNPVIPTGSNVQFTATGYFNNGSNQTMSSNLTWNSSSPAVATVNTNGLATGLAAGTTAIKAISGSVSNSTLLTVVAPPSISVQPTNNMVPPAGNVTLSVSATGGDLSYQWQFDGTNIAGATGATYAIPDVASTNIGVYMVVVSNPAGTNISQAAIVGTTAIQMFAGVIVDGPLGSNYVIQSTADLTNGWTTRTNLALPSQPYIYIDYSSPTNQRQFYRTLPQ